MRYLFPTFACLRLFWLICFATVQLLIRLVHKNTPQTRTFAAYLKTVFTIQYLELQYFTFQPLKKALKMKTKKLEKVTAESLVKQMDRQKCVTKYHKCITERIMGHRESVKNIKQFNWIVFFRYKIDFVSLKKCDMYRFGRLALLFPVHVSMENK